MPSPGRAPDRFSWLSTVRDVGHYFSKIGETLVAYAEEAEKAAGPYPRDESSSPHAPRETANGRAWPGRSKDPRTSGEYGYSYPPSGRPRSMPLYYDYLPVPISRGAYTAQEAMESRAEHAMHADMVDDAPGVRRRKRGPSSSAMDLEGESRRMKEGREKTSKRVRINWTEEENKIFFDTISVHSTLDESGVLKQIVSALKGSRNWVQCKGHFRNLVVVGRIAHHGDEEKQWVVVNDNPSKKAGTRSATSREESSGAPRKYTRLERSGGKADQESRSDLPNERGRDEITTVSRTSDEGGVQKNGKQAKRDAEDEEFVDSDGDEDQDAGVSIVDEEVPEVGAEYQRKIQESNGKMDAEVAPEDVQSIQTSKSDGIAAKSSQRRLTRVGADLRSNVPLKKQGGVSGGEPETSETPFRRMKDGCKRRMPQTRGASAPENGRIYLRPK